MLISLLQLRSCLETGPRGCRVKIQSVPQPALDQNYLLVVDDWNWPPAREGTQRALSALGAEVSYITIMTTSDGSHPNNHSENSDWHNGYFLAAVSKKA